MTRNEQTTGTLLVLAAAASWGTWSLFLRPTGLPATVSGPIIFAWMGLCLLPWCLRLQRAPWNRRVVTLLIANGVFDAINVLTFFAAMEHTSVAIAVLTHYLTPCLVALLAPVIDKQRSPHAAKLAIVALGGLTLVLSPWRAGSTGSLLGPLLGACSACFYAGNVFVVRRLSTEIGALRAMSYHSLVAAVVLLAYALITAAPFHLVSSENLVRLLIAASVIGAISGIAFLRGLVAIGSTRAALLTYAEPLVAVAVGALAFSEPLSIWTAVGGAIVLAAGAATVVVAKRSEAHA